MLSCWAGGSRAPASPCGSPWSGWGQGTPGPARREEDDNFHPAWQPTRDMVEQVRMGEREEGDLARFIARLWGNEIGMINPIKGDIENHEQLEELIFNVAKTENWSEDRLVLS